MRPIAILRSAIRRWLAERFDFPEIPRALTRLRAQGFVPEIVFDIGAYRGDFARACLATWPQTRIVCFEPLPQTQSVLQELARQDPRVSVHETLLGAKTLPRVKFYNGETESSVLLEKAIPQRNFIMCHQTTIDAVVCDSKVTPDFLKIDVQGYELEVMKGGATTLPHIKAILTEINLLDLHANVPLLADVVAWLAKRDFVAFEICGLTRRPLDNAMWQADFIFVPKDSPLRANKGYFPSPL